MPQSLRPRQRRAVFLVYASNMFVDAVGPFQTVAAEIGGELAAVAQLDVAGGALRALFVDAAAQGQGVGRATLAAVEARAQAAGCARLRGAMSLNAVPFYARAGFLALRRAGAAAQRRPSGAGHVDGKVAAGVAAA